MGMTTMPTQETIAHTKEFMRALKERGVSSNESVVKKKLETEAKEDFFTSGKIDQTTLSVFTLYGM